MYLSLQQFNLHISILWFPVLLSLSLFPRPARNSLQARQLHSLPSANLHSRFQSTSSLYHDAPTSPDMNQDEDMEGLHDFNQTRRPLHSLEAQVAQQQQQLTAMEEALARMSQAMERLSLLAVPTPSTTPLPPVPAPQPSQPLPQSRSAKVSPPDMFSGDRHKLYIYLSKCRHNFLSRPELFLTEPQKVLFASGYLDGAAYNWFQPLLDQYARSVGGDSQEEIPTQFQTFEQYAKSLEDTFGDPDIVRSKERELRNLNQTTSVATYLADFSRIKGFVKWNDEALASQFYKGLKPVVKDGLVYENPAPTTLAQLTSAALRIDSRQFERLLERKSESPALQHTYRAPRYPSAEPPPPRPSVTVTAPPVSRPTPAPSSDGSTPMELDLIQPYPSRLRGPLSNEEKQRRRELNLCHYCASPNHRIQTCPLAPVRPQQTQQIRMTEALVPTNTSTKDPAQE